MWWEAVVDSLCACPAPRSAWGRGSSRWFEWAPSRADVSDLPSRDPSTTGSRGVIASLRARVAAPEMCPRELWLPTAARLDDPELMVEAARAPAGDAVVNRHRALALYGV